MWRCWVPSQGVRGEADNLNLPKFGAVDVVPLLGAIAGFHRGG